MAKKQKSKKQIEEEAEKARKEEVDGSNEKLLADRAAREASLAKVPLTDEEQQFVNEMKTRMNCARDIDKPSAAEILRYSQLLKREKVK